MTTVSREVVIDDIIKKRGPVVREIEQMQDKLRRRKESLQPLKEMQERVMQSGIAALADSVKELPLQALQDEIDSTLGELQKLYSRFSRDTINIGVVGKARQGKSRLLQSLSGLEDGKVIPTGTQDHCTGVRSLICHDPSAMEPYGEITFYTEAEFLTEVLAPYYAELQLGDVPKSLNDFARLPLPPLPGTLPGYALPKEMYSHLEEEYRGKLQDYRQFIGHQTKLVSKDEIRSFVAQDTDTKVRIYQYLAVKEARIVCNFDYKDIGKIALVDMPGLGDTVVGAEKRLVRTLGEHIDIALFVLMPGAASGVLDKDAFSLYDLMYSAIEGLPISRWSFMVLNHTLPPLFGDNFGNCEYIKRNLDTKSSSYRNRSIEVQETIIANCAVADEARSEVLDRVLRYLVRDIRKLDVDFLNSWQKRLTVLGTKIDTILDQAKQALSPNTSQSIDDTQFEGLFREQYLKLATGLNDLRLKLTKEIGPNSTFKVYFEKTLKKCREDTGLPAPDRIKPIRNNSNAYRAAYIEFLNEVRTHLTQHFAKIDEELKFSMSSVKDRVARVFLEQGQLQGLMDGRPDTEFFQMMAEQKTLDEHLRSVCDGLARYELSLRGYFQSKIRVGNLDDLIPDKTKVDLPTPTEDAVLPTLERVQKEAVTKIEKTLMGETLVPSLSALAMIEEFIDQVLYSRYARDYWHAFFHTNRLYIWPVQFGEIARKEQIQSEWQTCVNNVITINQLDSLQFSLDLLRQSI